MHRNICSRSIASIVVPFLLMPLATSTVVAVVSSGGVGEANSMDRTIFPEETPDRIVSDQQMPLDALGYLGGLFEARTQIALVRTRPGHAVAKAARRATAG